MSGHPPPQAVHHELRTAKNSAAYLLAKLETLSTANPKLTLLDVGAGSGTISTTLAQALPHGFVTATDIKEDILPRARAVAQIEGVENIEFRQADIFKLPFDDDSFDVTHCHQVLTHLKEPWTALGEMIRVTKPGGVVAAREGDYETECVWPELPGLVRFHSFIASFMTRSGGNPRAGRQLMDWALKAGARRDQITASFGTWSYTTKEEKKVWAQGLIGQIKNGRMREAALSAKMVTESEFDEMVTAWGEWAESENSTLAMMSGEILIQK